MPCGGIYPIKGSMIEPYHKPEHPCWVCGKPDCTHFCEEWDTPMHAHCVAAFLLTEEGQCVIGHGHTVVVDYSLEVNHGTTVVPNQ